MYGKMMRMATMPKPRISDRQLATWRAFLRAHSQMLRRIGIDLDEAGLPPLAWYDVLAALHEAPDRRLRQVEIADRVLLSHSGLSRLIDRMQADGLLERTICDTDRRAFYVRLTDKGQEMLRRMWPVYARGITENFLPALGTNPDEIRESLETIAETCADDCHEARERTAAEARAARAA
jgi:DNA-binding MarR family transcriptional regulator